MSAETNKELIVEYPIDIVYETLISIFPVKYYDLKGYNHTTYKLNVIDMFNKTFTMKINLRENTPNTTIIRFLANYPHAIMDLTEGGKQAIETILEELLKQLDQLPKTGVGEAEDSDLEVVNKDNFVNTSKNKTHTISIVLGYVLCALSCVLPLIALANYDPEDFVMFLFFIVGILCLSIEISLSVILQYYEDSKAIINGRIQLYICGFIMIILGILIHPSLVIGGIIIPLIAMIYFNKRSKALK